VYTRSRSPQVLVDASDNREENLAAFNIVCRESMLSGGDHGAVPLGPTLSLLV